MGDCDDFDGSVYPDADEYCNGIDDDCDGDIDEAGVVDGSTYYEDVDGDGYGDPGRPRWVRSGRRIRRDRSIVTTVTIPSTRVQMNSATRSTTTATASSTMVHRRSVLR